MASVPSTRANERAGPRFHSDLTHKDIPFLISEDQRKIRHLQSISIRNLHIDTTRTLSRHRMSSGNGDFSAEEDPGLVRQLTRKLTKSSIDLKQMAADAVASSSIADIYSHTDDKESKFPDFDYLGDDGNDNSSNFLDTDIVVGLNDPVKRQLKLQDINKRSFLDVFFSLHELFNQSPFYISERLSRTLNPTFQDFDLTGYDISQGKFFTIIIWCKTDDDQEWRVLERLNIKLSFLIYAGDSFDAIVNQFDNLKNFLIFKMVNDCYYVLPTSVMSVDSIKQLSKNHQKYHQIHQPTCSFDQIMKLNNLQLCIYDSIETKNRLSKSIDEKLNQTPYFEVERKSAVDIIHNLKKSREDQLRLLQNQREAIDHMRLEMTRRKAILNQLKEDLPKTTQISDRNVILNNLRSDLQTTLEHIKYEKARISKVLLDIFKIEPNVDRPYDFQLFNLRFPSKSKPLTASNQSNSSIHSTQSNGSNNSSFFINVNIQSLTRTQEVEIAALLGYISQLIVTLSYYLQIPLRYPTEPFGCHSYIIDPISKIRGSRMFPLWIKENIIFRFEYGVLLLSKNIDQLMESQGLKSVDKNFLGNLQILLVCLSSNDKEMNSSTQASMMASKQQIKNEVNRMPNDATFPKPDGAKVVKDIRRVSGEYCSNNTISEPITTAITIPQSNYSEEDSNELIKNRDRIAVIKKKLSSLNLQRA